jgi:hypothetical protein
VNIPSLESLSSRTVQTAHIPRLSPFRRNSIEQLESQYADEGSLMYSTAQGTTNMLSSSSNGKDPSISQSNGRLINSAASRGSQLNEPKPSESCAPTRWVDRCHGGHSRCAETMISSIAMSLDAPGECRWWTAMIALISMSDLRGQPFPLKRCSLCETQREKVRELSKAYFLVPIS